MNPDEKEFDPTDVWDVSHKSTGIGLRLVYDLDGERYPFNVNYSLTSLILDAVLCKVYYDYLDGKINRSLASFLSLNGKYTDLSTIGLGSENPNREEEFERFMTWVINKLKEEEEQNA